MNPADLSLLLGTEGRVCCGLQIPDLESGVLAIATEHQPLPIGSPTQERGRTRRIARLWRWLKVSTQPVPIPIPHVDSPRLLTDEQKVPIGRKAQVDYQESGQNGPFAGSSE